MNKGQAFRGSKIQDSEVQCSMQISTVDTSTLNFGSNFGLKKHIHGTAVDSYVKLRNNFIESSAETYLIQLTFPKKKR